MKHVLLLFSLLWGLSVLGQTKSLSDDLIFSFPMDAAVANGAAVTGTTPDVSGNGRNGTIAGAITAAADRFGNPSGALQFNSGTDNKTAAAIDLAYGAAIGTSNFTTSFWVSYGTTIPFPGIITKEKTNVNPNQCRFGGYGDWANTLVNGTGDNWDTVNFSPTLNQWYHYVVVRNAATLSVYINGKLLRSKTNASGTLNHTGLDNYRIGGNQGGLTYFNGKLDELRMYSRALTASEIATLYSSDYLQAYFPLNGDAKDYSGNKFDGTIPANNVIAIDDRFGNANSAYYLGGGAEKATIIRTTARQIAVTNYSVSAWVKMASGEGGSIISNRNNGGNTTCAGIFLDVQSNGTVRMGANGWSYLVASQTSATITDSKWHHITGVFSCPSGTSVSNAHFLIYIDGMPMALTNANGGNRTFQSPISGDGNTYIGECKDVINVFTKTTQGAIDEVKIYNRSLSATDVKRMYADRSAVSTKGLLLYYPLNGDTKDYSGNGLDGNINTYKEVDSIIDRFGNANSAYSFGVEKTSGAIDRPTDTKLDFKSNDSMSFSCWLNLKDLDRIQSIFQKDRDAGAFWYNTITKRIQFGDNYDETKTYVDDSYVSALINQWNHVALTVTPSTKKVFVNGKLVLQTTGTFDLSSMNEKGIAFGHAFGTVWYPLNGSLDDIRLYKRELSQAEIVQLASDKPNTLAQNGAYSTIPNPFTTSNKFTAEMWVKPTNAGSFQGFFGQVSGDTRIVPCMWVHGNGLHFVLNGNNSTPISGVLPDFFYPNEWTHVAWVSDGTTCSFYKNGELRYTCPMTISALVTTTDIRLGAADNATIVGQLDEVRVWSTARTQQEIKDNMYKELGAVAGLSASYSFTGSMKNSAASNSGKLNSTAQLVIGSALRTVFMQPATNITAAGFTANWLPGSPAISYQLQSSVTTDFTSVATQTTNTNSLAITGVDSVYLRVRAIFAAGDTSAWSNTYRASRLFAPTGLALSFNPSNQTSDVTFQYAKVPSGAWFKKDFTVSTWVYIRKYNGTLTRIFDFGNATGSGSDNVLFDPYRGILDVYNGITSVSMIVPRVATGTWVNVAITQASGITTIYYNGVAQTCQAGGTQMKINQPKEVITYNNYIGKANWSENFLNMMLDEFCIYNKALTQTEVQTRMYQHLTGSEEGLLLYYDFDNINGNLIADRTGKGQNATLTSDNNTGLPSLVKSTVSPTLAASNVTASSFTANWTAMAGATGYQIEWSKFSDFKEITNSESLNSTSYTITPNFSPVYFRVRAVYGANKYSDWGTTAYFTAPGNGVDLTNTASLASTEIVGKCVQIAENAQLTKCLQSSFTIDAWIYPRSYKDFCRLFDFGNRNAQTGNCMVGFWNGSANPFFQIGGKNCVASSVLVPINQWSHIALRYDAVAKQAVFYLNGIVIPTRQDGNNNNPLNVSQAVTSTLIGTSYPLNYIGRSNGTDSYTDAIIDEFRVSNQALLQDTIIARSHRHLSGKETDLVLYYDFDQVSGTSIPNLATNTGALANGSVFNNTAFVASKALVTPFIRTATNKRVNGLTINWDVVPGASYKVEYANNNSFTDSKIDSTTNAYYTLTANYSPVYFRVQATAKNVVSEWATTSYITAPGTGVDLTNTTNLACSNTTGKYVQVPAGKWFQTDFTVDGWINLKDYKDNNWIRWFDFGLGQDNSNVLFGLNATDNQSYSSTRNGATPSDHAMARIPLNTWTHVALVMKNNILTVYYNGEQIAANYKANRAPANTVFTSNYIGRSNWVSSNITTELYTNATFDEFRIYNTALSRDSIIARSHRHLKGNEDSLLLYYDFDQISGNVVPNLAVKTGAAGNGTIFNNAPLVASKALVTPFTRAATNITVKGFTANWDSVPGTNYKVEYANNSNFTGSTTATTAKPFYAIETNYSPVYFRVQATVGSLVSEWSSATYFTAPGNGIDLTNPIDLKSLDTKGKYVQVPAGKWLSGNFTVDAWVYVRDNKAYQRLFDFGTTDGTTGGANNKALALTGKDSSSPYFRVAAGDVRYLSTSFPLSQWAHVALSNDSTNKTTKVYINGEEVNNSLITSTAVNCTSNFIGRSNWASDNYTNAIIDEFHISNQALSRDSIIARSHRHLSGKELDLVLYYDFDQISDTIIPNLAAKTGATGNGKVFNNAPFVDSKAMITPFIRKVDTMVVNKVTISWDTVPGASYEVRTAQTADFVTNYQTAISTNTAFTATLANNQSVCFYRVRTTAPFDTSAWQTGVVTIKKRGVQNMAFQAINPDVSKSELSITNTSDIKIAGGDQVTMSCWAKFSSLNNTGIMMQGGGSGTSGKWLRVNNGMFDVLYNYDNGGSSSTCGWQSFCSPAIIETGKWYHLAYTLDANKRITLYVNGVKYIPTGTFFTFTGSKPGENILHSTWAIAKESTQPMTVGSANCTIDNFQIWKTALSQDEIIKYANTPVTGKETDLAVAYNFNQIDGATVSDLTTTTATPATVVNNPLLWKASNAELTPLARITAANDSTLTVSWDTVPAATYKLKYGTKADLSDAKTISQAATSKLFDDLLVSTNYYFSAKAITATDSSDWSVPVKGSLLGLNDSLIAYYPFNSSAKDESGNGADGTISSATAVTPSNDRFGNSSQAYKFSGGNVKVTDGTKNNLDGSYTIAAWVNSNSSTSYAVVSKYNWTTSTVANKKKFDGYMLSLAEGNPKKYLTQVNTSDTAKYNVSKTQIPLNQWKFVCATYSSNKTLTLWVDGDTVFTQKNVAPNVANQYPFFIGAYQDGVDPFQGTIDDIRLYRRSLSKKEIATLYHQNGWPYTGVAISKNTLVEQLDKGAEVGKLLPQLADGAKNTCKTISYKLVTGTGSTDNDKFVIEKDSILKTAFIFDTTKQRTASIRVQAATCDGIIVEGVVAINIVGNATSEVYDFNKLTVGALGTQDGWNTKEVNGAKVTVGEKDGTDGSKALIHSGDLEGNYFATSKTVASMFPSSKPFTQNSMQTTLSYDVYSSAWGAYFGLKAKNGNEAFTLKITATNQGETFTVLDKSVPLVNSVPNDWARVAITFGMVDANTAEISVQARTLAAANSTWIQIVAPYRFTVDTTKGNTSETNLNLWDSVAIKNYGTKFILDNIALTQRTVNSKLTGLNDGLLAYYNMNNNMNDVSGNENHGKESNIAPSPTPTFDRFGQANAAYAFDGTQNFAVAGMGKKLPATNVSFSVWAKEDEIQSSSLFTLSDDVNSNRVNAHVLWGGTTMYWDYGNITGQNTGRLEAKSNPSYNTDWHHYVFISGNGGMKIYVDNVLLDQQTATSNFTPIDTALLIGGLNRIDGGAHFFKGSMDDFRIYNRELSSDDVRMLYTEGDWPIQSIKAEGMTLKVGTSGQMKVNIMPEGILSTGLIYTSGDTKYATVSTTGMVTGVAAGTVLITVSTPKGIRKSQATITVKSNVEPITAIALPVTELTLLKGDSYTFKYTTTPPTNVATSNIAWSSTNGHAAPIKDGVLSALAPCSDEWIYVYADSTDKTVFAKCKITILPSALPTLSKDTLSHFSLKAIETINGVQQPKDTLKLSLTEFFVDDSVLTYSYKMSSITDTIQVSLVNNVLQVYSSDTLIQKLPLKITITATDIDNQTVSKDVYVQMKSTPDEAPKVSAIAVDTLLQFRKTATIDLRKYVVDDYTSFASLVFDSLQVNKRDTATIKNGIVTLTVRPTSPSAFSDTVRLQVYDSRKQRSKIAIPYEFKYVKNSAPVFAKIDTLNQESSDATIVFHLNRFVSDDFTPTSQLKWSFDPAQNVNIQLKDSTLFMSASSSAWDGTEMIKVYAQDEASAKASALIPFHQIVNLSLDGIPNVDFELNANGTTAPKVFVQRGAKVTFTMLDKSNNTVGIESWNWVLNGATPNAINGGSPIEVQYNTVGVYDAILYAKNGSGPTKVARQGVVQVVGIMASRTKVCTDSTATLWASDSTSGNQYNWSTGAKTASIVLPVTKDTVISLTITKGTTSIKDSIHITYIKQLTNVADDFSICPGTSKEITPTGFSSLLWNGTPMTSYLATKAEKIEVKALVDAACPVVIDDIKVSELAAPKITLSTNKLVLCGLAMDTVVAKATGDNNSFSWSDGTTKNDTLYVNKAGRYVVTVTSGNKCWTKDSVEVVSGELPKVIAYASESKICKGGLVKLTVRPSDSLLSYQWNVTRDADSMATVASVSNNDYWVTATNKAGCSASDSVRVVADEPAVLGVSASPNGVVCANTMVALSATGATSVVWSNGVTNNQPFIISTSNKFYVTATTGTCTQRDSISISVHKNPVVNITASPNDTLCKGDKLTLTANGGNEYRWNGSVTNGQAFTIDQSTIFYVTVTDANKCVTEQGVDIVVNEFKNFKIVPSKDSICAGDSVMLDVRNAALYDSDGQFKANEYIKPKTTGINIYKALGTDANGCKANAQTTVVVKATPTVIVTPVDSVCTGATAVLTATGTATEYKWSDNVKNDESFVPSASKRYFVTATANSCSDTSSVMINIKTGATAGKLTIANRDVKLCQGDSLKLDGEGAFETIVWNNNIDDNTWVTPSKDSIFTVKATDIKKCVTTDAVKVTVNNRPEVTAHLSTAISCQGRSIKLWATATQTVSYEWSETLSASDSSYVLTALGEKTFIVTATNDKKCSDTAKVKVTVNPAVTVDLKAIKDTICAGDSVLLDAKGVFAKASWSSGAANGKYVKPTQSTQYNVLVTDNIACESKDSIQVVVHALPNVTANHDTTVCAGRSITLAAKGATKYSWNNGAVDGVAKAITDNTTFTVTGTDANKCSDTAVVKVSALKPYKEQLGVVTYDSATSKKVIIAWNRHKGQRTERYVVLRQNGTSLWDTIGRRAFADSALIVDKTADLDVKTFSYKLVTIDSVCHNQAVSDEHRTMHVTSSVTDGVNVSVSWNTYLGLDLASYYVVRINPDGKMQYLDTIANNALDMKFTDKHPVLNARYRILYNLPEKVSPVLTKSDTGPFSQSMSNMSEASLVSCSTISNDELSVWPIPANDKLHVSIASSILSVQLINDSGVQLQLPVGKGSDLDYLITNIANGLYILQVYTTDGLFVKKISIQH